MRKVSVETLFGHRGETRMESIKCEGCQPSGPPYPAFLTTALVGGPRTLISGERLVVVLGHDPDGRPLEVSIDLFAWAGGAGELRVYALQETGEPLAERLQRRHWPRLVVTPSKAPNFVSISVRYDDVGEAQPKGGIPEAEPLDGL